jgi:hypothetical protein
MVRQATKGPISAAGSERFFRGLFEVSREEAPEEMIFRSRDAAEVGLRVVGRKAGRESGSSQEGPLNIGRF